MLEEDENQFLEDTYEIKKKKRKGNTEKDAGNAFFWCHQCKQKHIEVVCCTKTCSKKYCVRCVRRHYKEKVEDVDKDNWVCYYCQGLCSCAFCRRRRAKETNTKFESHRGKKRTMSSEENSARKKRKTKSLDETKIDSSQIEQIYARCTKENKSIYLLKIKNESEVTWVPEHELTVEITSNFSSSQILILPTKATHDSTIAEIVSESNLDQTNKIDNDVNDEIISIEPTNDPSFQSKPMKGKSLESTSCLQESMKSLNVLNDCSNDIPIEVNNEKISIKDLLDSGILREGDILSIQNVDETATLLGNGTISWRDTLFKSLESFVKAATRTDNKYSFRNNEWRKVNCRGKTLQYFTLKYQKRSSKPRKVATERKNEAFKEEQISQVDLNEDTIDESKSISENNKYELTQEIAVTPSPIDSSPSITHDNNGFLQNQTNSKNFANTLHNLQSQINDSIQEDDDNIWNEEIVYYDQCYHSLVHFQHDEHDKDILVSGNQDQYFDLKDNDFFNVNNPDYDLIPRSYHSLEIEGWVDLKPN